MNNLKYLWLAFLIATRISVGAQPIFSSNVVGYANIYFYAGNNLFSSPFGEEDNSLNTLFQVGAPQGTTFTEWDSLTQNYLPLSIYDANSGWSINYILGYGQGGLLNTPINFTNTFAGTVWPGWNLQRPANTPLVTNTGSLLLSSYIPWSDATFFDVVGRNPQNGESVKMLDALSQTYTITIFQDDLWNNGAPSLGVGQAAFFNLSGPVPEPEFLSLFGAGVISLLAFRLREKR